MKKAFDALPKDLFVMLAVSIDEEGMATVDPFLQKVFPQGQSGFPVFLDTNQKASRSMGTYKVPETYIIDKTGKVVDKVEGTKEWEDPLFLHYMELLTRQ